jgi:competence protein ComEC
VLLLGYALLVGGRPPVLRSAVMVCAACGGLWLRRPVLLANSFALSWIAVAVLNPTDVFDTGCQLSFLSVAVLYWGTRRWLQPVPGGDPDAASLSYWSFGRWLSVRADPLQQLRDEARPPWLRGLFRLGRSVCLSYAVAVAVTLAVTPLVAARYNLVAPVALVLGPPLALLTSAALLTGFFVLLASLFFPPLVPLFAWGTAQTLAACEALVHWFADLPVSHVYVGMIPDWWLWVFYLALLAALLLEPLRRRWRWLAPTGLAWACAGLLGGASGAQSTEFRCTFLAVGHGGCTVLEAPNGRTLLYDAGSLSGPEVTRRQISIFHFPL